MLRTARARIVVLQVAVLLLALLVAVGVTRTVLLQRLDDRVDRALLVELGDTDLVVAWAQALRELSPPGIADLVPAAATLLVMVDEGADVAAVEGGLSRVAADLGVGVTLRPADTDEL